MNQSLRYQSILYIVNFLALLVLLSVSFLSNLLPINGQLAGEVANQYEPLFHLADFTSSIWIAIYALLVAYLIFHFNRFRDPKGISGVVTSGIGLTFMIACLTNAAWIIAWHYEQLITTVILSVILLLSLIDINRRIRKIELEFHPLPKSFRWLVKLPFGLYLGWVMIVFISNISLYLIANGWDHVAFSPGIWAITFIIFTGILGLYLMQWLKSFAPAIAIAWGLFGILFTHWEDGSYDYIQIASFVMMVLIGIGSAKLYQKINSIEYKNKMS